MLKSSVSISIVNMSDDKCNFTSQIASTSAKPKVKCTMLEVSGSNFILEICSGE